jgi:FAD:protein FMN transferase
LQKRRRNPGLWKKPFTKRRPVAARGGRGAVPVLPRYMRRLTMLCRALTLLFAACAVLVAGCEGDRRPFAQAEFSGKTMGFMYHIKVVTPKALSTADQETLHAAAFGALDAVDRRMSTYKPDSELSRLNASQSTEPYAISPELAEVLAKARETSEFSEGGFDVTVGPLVNAWGFGPLKERGIPSAEEVSRLKQRVGYRLLTLDRERLTVTKARPDLYVDLAAIASGYGVDQAAQALEARGVTDYMVEAGGEVRTKGHNAEGKPWQVAIVRPDVSPQQPYLIVPLSGAALSTSGDYRNFFEKDGKRYSHHIDPASGYPVEHNLASVSVVMPHSVDAKRYAAALCIVGPDKGYRLAEERKLAAYFIVRESDGRFTIRETPAFAALKGQLVDKP